jgi:hypothetical protein
MEMKDCVIFYHEGGLMFAGDTKGYDAGWYVCIDCEYRPAEMHDDPVTQSMLVKEEEWK